MGALRRTSSRCLAAWHWCWAMSRQANTTIASLTSLTRLSRQPKKTRSSGLSSLRAFLIRPLPTRAVGAMSLVLMFLDAVPCMVNTATCTETWDSIRDEIAGVLAHQLAERNHADRVQTLEDEVAASRLKSVGVPYNAIERCNRVGAPKGSKAKRRWSFPHCVQC